MRHLVLFEVAIWVSVARWIARRPAVPPGAVTLPYGQLVAPILWLFVLGSAVEVIAVDLILGAVGWDVVRLPVLILGVWSLVWMLGLLAAVRTRPHVVTDDALWVRAGLRHEVVVPLARIASLSARADELSSSMKSVELVGERLLLGVSGRTNVVAVLDRPTTLRTGTGLETVVTELGFWVDEPRAATATIRERVGAG